MKIMKTYEEPAKKYELTDYVICDMCGSNKGDDGVDGYNWRDKYNYFSETILQLEEGSRYPEGGNSEKTEIHICDKCMKEKLFPWLVTQGVTIPKPIILDW